MDIEMGGERRERGEGESERERRERERRRNGVTCCCRQQSARSGSRHGADQAWARWTTHHMLQRERQREREREEEEEWSYLLL